MSAEGKVLLAESAAKTLHAGPGSVVAVELDSTRTILLTVSGTYDSARGAGSIIASPGGVDGERVTAQPDLVVTGPQFEALQLDGTAYSIRSLARPVRLEDVAPIQSDVAAARAASLSVAGAQSDGRVDSGLPGVLGDIAPQHTAAGVLLIVVGLEALGLAWFAEALVIQRVGRVRAAEWGVGRLRGLDRRTWLESIFVEPGIALIAGSLAGFGVGIAAAAGAASWALGPSALIQPVQPLVFAAAALALFGSLVALVAASVRSARLPLASLLRETTEPRSCREEPWWRRPESRSSRSWWSARCSSAPRSAVRRWLCSRPLSSRSSRVSSVCASLWWWFAARLAGHLAPCRASSSGVSSPAPHRRCRSP
ncbi:hypothetical protein GCM10025867_01260 [Frondihabitans sucicola]|uniref:FtsX-like permease family protein n=1 Tax=Frondihabitans sucicola TaxID=1268041 RepID=A0ABN6XW71_9MICO|nr:hypothetical protein [Frondihabitans sucicola]BDZ47885.1 hypothetical protein GCM10025867_01260 [Frondihabitans sucicola]